jgi:hypothetical protein
LFSFLRCSLPVWESCMNRTQSVSAAAADLTCVWNAPLATTWPALLASESDANPPAAAVAAAPAPAEQEAVAAAAVQLAAAGSDAAIDGAAVNGQADAAEEAAPAFK